MIEKGRYIRYVIIAVMAMITIMALKLASQSSTIQVNIDVRGVGPLSNATVTYMEFIQSYTTQMLQAYGTTATNNNGVALIPQPPPPLAGKEDVITITINATVNGSPIFRTYTFYLTNENFTNQINITIPMLRINNSTSNASYSSQSMFLIAIIVVIIVVLIVIIIALVRGSRK